MRGCREDSTHSESLLQFGSDAVVDLAASLVNRILNQGANLLNDTGNEISQDSCGLVFPVLSGAG
jgi:hypothetical protein